MQLISLEETNLGAATPNDWYQVNKVTSDVFYGLFLCMIIAMFVKLHQKKDDNSPDAMLMDRKLTEPLLLFLFCFSSWGITYWFRDSFEEVFWFDLFNELGYTFYVAAWIFLANNLRTIDLDTEAQAIANPRRRVPWHLIVSVLALGNAIIWIMVLSIGNHPRLTDAFGHAVCWGLLCLFVCWDMAMALKTLSVQEDITKVPKKAIASGKFAVFFQVIWTIAITILVLISDFVYDEAQHAKSYYSLTYWLLSFILFAGISCILGLLMFTVFGKDPALYIKEVIYDPDRTTRRLSISSQERVSYAVNTYDNPADSFSVNRPSYE